MVFVVVIGLVTICTFNLSHKQWFGRSPMPYILVSSEVYINNLSSKKKQVRMSKVGWRPNV